MNLEDRFIRGFIAGISAGIVMDILEYLSFILKITELSYWEWASVLIFGYRATALTEVFLALMLQIFFSGVVGILFAYFVPLVTSRYYLMKGALFSIFICFLSNAVIYMFKVTPLAPVKADTVFSNIVTVAIYGLVLAQMLRWMDNKLKV